MTLGFDSYKDYVVAFIAALVLHAMIFGGIETGLMALADDSRRFVVEPKPLRAELIRLQITQPPPQPAPAVVAPTPSQESTEEPSEVAESKEEQLERLARERAERLAAIRESAFKELRDSEISRETDNALQDLASLYIEGIYLSLVANWSRPPSARNNMSAVIQVELFPNGELNTVSIIEPSGDFAFDRSAINAVERASPFEVPSDLELFEARFRTFRLNFQPEDLLR